MSRELANPAHAAQWLRRVLKAMRDSGVEVITVEQLEQAINEWEGRHGQGRTGS